MKTYHPNDLGEKLLVEDCQKIRITTYIQQAKAKLKNALLASELEIDNKTIELIPSKTAFGGIRYWFKCPICGSKVGTLFVHPISHGVGCRKCLSLEYRSRRYKGMIESHSCLI